MLFSLSRLISLGVLLAASGALARAATVSGTVADSSGAEVSGAIVNLHQIAGSALLTVTSDRTGRFSFNDVAAGEYLVDATAPGLNIAQPLNVHVAEDEKKELRLELAVSAVRSQVSVTAASEPQSVDQVSKALDVVSVAETERRGIVSVSDAVRFLPGLRVTTSGGPGALTTIQSRGLPPEDTSILIDGFRFRDPTAPKGDATAQIGDLLLVDTSRIEVLRGSGSSLYGTNAVSGAVNVITRPGEGPLHGDLDLQGGGLGLFRGVARAAGSALGNKFGYSAGIANLNVTRGVDDVGAVRNWSGQSSLSYALTPKIRLLESVFAKTGYLQENVSPMPTADASASEILPAIPLSSAQIKLADQGLPYDPGTANFIPSLGDPDARVNSRFVDSIFRFEHEVNSRLSYRLSYALVDSVRDNHDGPGGPGFFQPLFNTYDKYGGRIDTAQGRIDYLLGSHQVLSAGYEFERERFQETAGDQNPDITQRAYYVTDARQRTHAVFAQDEIRLLNGRLAVLLSGRFTQASLDQPKFVNAPSPYAGLMLSSPPAAYTGDAAIAYFLRTSSTKLRAHAGNSFRLPSLYERFGQSVFDGIAYTSGDPRLSPERAVSFDFGFDQYLFHEHLKVSGTYFYAHLQQVIGYRSFPPGYVDPYGRFAGYYNTGGGLSRGVEVSGEWRPSSRTAVSASYTYTATLDRISQYPLDNPVSPLESVRIEPHAVKLVATHQLTKHADLAMDFEGASDFLFPLYGFYGVTYRFPGPRQLGLAAGYSMNLGERFSTRFYVRVSNALDQDFYENGFRTAPRWAVAGIHFGF